MAPLEIEISKYKEQLEAIATDLNGTDIFLGYDWLVKHNLEVNWKNGMIKFMRYPRSCKMKHQDIKFKTRRTQETETKEQDNGEIGKEPNKMNQKTYQNIFDYLYIYSTRSSKSY